MLLSLIQSIWTVVVMIIFFGIVWWAYSGHRKEAFDEAARLPLEDEVTIKPQSSKKE
jgi:cytochrome c oxidase cbb3-type subunit 4